MRKLHIRKHPEQTKRECIRLVNLGYSIREVSEKMKIPTPTIRDWCRKLGIKVKGKRKSRRRLPLPEKAPEEELLRKVYELAKSGYPNRDIARELGISTAKVGMALKIIREPDYKAKENIKRKARAFAEFLKEKEKSKILKAFLKAFAGHPVVEEALKLLKLD